MTIHKDMTLRDVLSESISGCFDDARSIIRALDYCVGGSEDLQKVVASIEKSKGEAISAIGAVKNAEFKNNCDFEIAIKLFRHGVYF